MVFIKINTHNSNSLFTGCTYHISTQSQYLLLLQLLLSQSSPFSSIINTFIGGDCGKTTQLKNLHSTMACLLVDPFLCQTSLSGRNLNGLSGFSDFSQV